MYTQGKVPFAGGPRVLALSILWGCSFAFSLNAADAPVEPLLKSVFPSIAQSGSAVTVQFRGTHLDGAYALWLDSPGIEGEVKSVEPVDEPAAPQASPTTTQDTEPAPPTLRVVVELRVDSSARPGTHWVRLVSPGGLSNAAPFLVTTHAVEVEADQPHLTAEQAETTQAPALINGRLEQSGEVDHYSFPAAEGDELHFEVIQAQELKPRLALYGASASWFDPNRRQRVPFREERSSDLVPTKAQGTYRVPRSGRYTVEVSSLYGQGSPDSSYVLAISKGDKRTDETEPQAAGWTERSFKRKIGDGWLDTVTARAFSVPKDETVSRAGETAATTPVASSTSPADVQAGEALSGRPALVTEAQLGAGNPERKIPFPAILDGTIGDPADVDRYRFQVREGQEIAVEIETPGAQLPEFNPWVTVLDAENREVFSNLHRKVSLFNNNAERQVFLQGVEPKAVHRLDRAGEYVLRVEDITPRYGDTTYRYRILVRPQIPHVGEISLGGVDRVNLVQGGAGRITLNTTYEEGFTGDVTFSFQGLPEGVQAFPSAPFVEKRDPTEITDNPKTVLAPTNETTVVLAVSPDAPLTHLPRVVRIECRVLAEGKLGPALLVRELPVMVIAEDEGKQEANDNGRL